MKSNQPPVRRTSPLTQAGATPSAQSNQTLKKQLVTIAIIKKSVQRSREIAFAIIYRLKTSALYRKLRSIKALHAAYMSIKARIKKAGRYEIGLTDEQLKTNVLDYLEARKARPPAKVVVYTAVVDNYDALKIPLELNPDWDYVCFTDRAEFEGIHPWLIRPIPYIDADPTRCARFTKLRADLCLPEYEQSIWIDANILIRNTFLNQAFEMFSSSPHLLAGIPHPQRSCTYDEFSACKELNKDVPEILDEQNNFYRDNHFKPQQGMIETNLLFRKHHHPKVVEFQKIWWKLLNKFSRRDQLSIMPALESASLDWMEIMPKGMFIANHPSFYIFFHGAKWSPDAIQYKVPGFLPRDFCASTKPFWRESRTQPFTAEHISKLPEDPVDIVICVHNAPEDVDRCLESVLKHIQPHDRVIIVDDGSDSQTASIIDRHAGTSQQCTIIRHTTPIGYTRSANVGLQASNAELVILLNSDTVVTANWARKLQQVASQSPHIGIVGPLSNAASFQSIPRVRDPKTGGLAINTLARGKTIEDLNSLCEHYGNTDTFPLVPLINGFCMGITRRVIETIGYFDEESFPLGYGEEDDYTQRAIDAGFMHAIATHCYVYHAKSKSFGSARRAELVEMGATHLRRKHGEHRINRAVATMAKHPILGSIRHQIARELKVKTADTYRLELSLYPGLFEENAQSVLLSREVMLERQSSGTAPYERSTNLIIIGEPGQNNVAHAHVDYKQRTSQINNNIHFEFGTIEDVFTKAPEAILVKDIKGYSKNDLRELISFCKSRSIQIYRPSLSQNSHSSPTKLAKYIDKHADRLLSN